MALRYEKGEVKHVGHFPKLEEQMLMRAPGRMKKSPGRVDALVWLITELLPSAQGRVGFFGRKGVGER